MSDTRQSSIVLPFVNHEVLMLRRGPTDPWKPGHWNFPGGKVDPGENPMQAAVRELSEEAGIRVPEKALSWSFSYRGYNRLIHVFSVRLRRKPVVRSRDGEHDAATWVPWGRWLNPSIPDVPFIVRQAGRV